MNNLFTRMMNIWNKRRLLSLFQKILAVDDVANFRENFTDKEINLLNVNQLLFLSLENRARRIILELVQFDIDPNYTDSRGQTLLHEAAFLGDVEIIKFLVRLGGDVNAITEYGKSVLCAAAANNIEAVKLLLTFGADPNISTGEFGSTYEFAIMTGNTDLLEELLKGKIIPNLKLDLKRYQSKYNLKKWKEIIRLIKLKSNLSAPTDPSAMCGPTDPSPKAEDEKPDN